MNYAKTPINWSLSIVLIYASSMSSGDNGNGDWNNVWRHTEWFHLRFFFPPRSVNSSAFDLIYRNESSQFDIDDEYLLTFCRVKIQICIFKSKSMNSLIEGDTTDDCYWIPLCELNLQYEFANAKFIVIYSNYCYRTTNDPVIQFFSISLLLSIIIDHCNLRVARGNSLFKNIIFFFSSYATQRNRCREYYVYNKRQCKRETHKIPS